MSIDSMGISRWRRGLVLVSVGVAGLVGCSSGAAGSSTQPASPPPASAAVAPEDQRATAADVAAGMRKIDQIARDIVAAGDDRAKATELDGQIEPQWKQIEGTVKANDQDTYLTMEDAFAVLQKAATNGDAAAAAKGAAAISPAVSGYLARYPG